MKLFRITILLVVFLSIAESDFGQDSIKCKESIFNDQLLEKLIGNWDANGQVGGEKVTYHFNACWELNHQFVALTFADTAKQPQYSAKVFIGYDCVSERYVVHWLDNFGGRFSETLGYGIKSGNTIEFRFEYPDGPFINKFIYDINKDTWQFHTTTKNNNGIWIIFGDIYLKRKH